MAKKTKKEKDEKFEVLISRLDEIVRMLEEGDLELEEALAAFEEGVGVGRRLNEILSEAKERIEILVRDGQGQTGLQPFEEDGPNGGDDDPR